MKFAKKMRLVEFDSTAPNLEHMYNQLLPDNEYAKPRVLSKLDSSMSEILNRNDIPDSKKLIFYNELLRKYLHFTNKNNSAHLVQSNNDVIPPSNFDLGDSFTQRSMTDLLPGRDSLDNITQPSVRDFFESLREENRQPSNNSLHEQPTSLSPNENHQANSLHNIEQPVVRQFFNALREGDPQNSLFQHEPHTSFITRSRTKARRDLTKQMNTTKTSKTKRKKTNSRKRKSDINLKNLSICPKSKFRIVEWKPYSATVEMNISD